MKAYVSQTLINTTDRTVDLTVQMSTDLNVLIQTLTLSIPADIYDKTTIMERVRTALQTLVTQRSTYPLTQSQADALGLGVSIRIPG